MRSALLRLLQELPRTNRPSVGRAGGRGRRSEGDRLVRNNQRGWLAGCACDVRRPARSSFAPSPPLLLLQVGAVSECRTFNGRNGPSSKWAHYNNADNKRKRGKCMQGADHRRDSQLRHTVQDKSADCEKFSGGLGGGRQGRYARTHARARRFCWPCLTNIHSLLDWKNDWLRHRSSQCKRARPPSSVRQSRGAESGEDGKRLPDDDDDDDGDGRLAREGGREGA